VIVGVETDGLEVWDNNKGWVSAPAEPMEVRGAEQEPPADDNKYHPPHPANHTRWGMVTLRIPDAPAQQGPTGEFSNGGEASPVGKFIQQGGTVKKPTSTPAAAVNRSAAAVEPARSRD
jgi:hypothetical protein